MSGSIIAWRPWAIESPAMSTLAVPAGSGAWLAGGADAPGATVVAGSWPGMTIVFGAAGVVVAGATAEVGGAVVAAAGAVVVGPTTATTLGSRVVAAERAVEPLAGLGEADRRREVVERVGDTGGDRAGPRPSGLALRHVAAGSSS